MNDNPHPNAQVRAAMAMTAAVTETIRECGADGAPGGVLYAALMANVTLEGFERMMELIVRTGLVRKSGQCYYWVEPAEENV